MKKVTSEISGTVFSLPWLVAKDQGLFEAEGPWQPAKFGYFRD